jgi:hypothetical protein
MCGKRFGLAESSQFARARSLRGDSITDERSKLDLVRPMSSSATSPNFRIKPEDDGLCQTIGKNIGEIFSTTSIIEKSSYFCEKVAKSPVAQIPNSGLLRLFPALTFLFSMFFLKSYINTDTWFFPLPLALKTYTLHGSPYGQARWQHYEDKD